MFKDLFIEAIKNKRKVRVTFFSKEDNGTIVRTCAPMDFGPSRTAKDKKNKYHFWDYDSDKKCHPLPLNPEQIHKMELLDEYFEPEEFITWDTNKSPWFIPRNWGKFS